MLRLHTRIGPGVALLLLASCGAPNGDAFVVFDTAYDIAGDDWSSALAVATSGEILVAGQRRNRLGDPTSEDLTFVRVDKNGQALGSRTIDLAELLAPPKLESVFCVGSRAGQFTVYGSLHTPGQENSTRVFGIRGSPLAERPGVDVGTVQILSNYNGLVHEDGTWVFGGWTGDDGREVHALHYSADLTSSIPLSHGHPGENCYVGSTGHVRADGSLLLAVSFGERHGSADSEHEIVRFTLGAEPQAVSLGAIADVALTGVSELPGGRILCTATIGKYRVRRGLLIACDPNGSILWRHELGLGKETVISGVGSIRDLGWMIGGFAYDGGADAASAWAARIDATGEPSWIWQRRAIGTMGNPPALTVAGDRGYLLTQALRHETQDLNLIGFDLSR